MKIPEGGRKMNKPPYTYFEVERRDYWSGTRLVGMLVGVMLMLAVFGVIFMSCDLKPAHADTIPTTGLCTYYTVASCLHEGTSGIMANGRKLDDTKYTAASWFYKFGTVLLVTNTKTGRSIQVVVSDRGPAKRLVKKGKIIDLSRAAFLAIGNLRDGVIPVRVEVES
jgi:rare lipoprotein A (peptidoglycan hydrolase)